MEAFLVGLVVGLLLGPILRSYLLWRAIMAACRRATPAVHRLASSDGGWVLPDDLFGHDAN